MTGEYELRYRIRDISHFMKALSLSGASFNYKYKCTDYYYTPSGDMDYLNGKNLRIRHRTSPEESSTLYFDKYEIIKIAGVGLKRSIYHGGKVVLFIGDLKECRSIAKDLGFKPLFSINKGEGGLIHKKLGKYLLKTFIENTSSFGWSGEIEYDGTPKEIAAKLRADIAFLESIGIKRKDLTGDPLSVLYARSAHFI